jgi:hypothetical protein
MHVLWPDILLFSPIESYKINVLGPMLFIMFQLRSPLAEYRLYN